MYPWAAAPLFVLSLAALILGRAHPDLRRLLDLSALAVLLVIAVQLIPLPPSLQDLLSPELRSFHREMHFDADPQRWRPLSLHPARTGTMLLLAASAVAMFFTVGHLTASSARRLARWIAWMAMAAALLGFAGLSGITGGRVYGIWAPHEIGAAPFGPMINRNHFAAWALVALSIAAGALATQAVRRRDRTARARVMAAALSDTRGLWLLAAIAITAAAIIVTGSRGGFIAMAATSIAAAAMGWRRAGSSVLWAFAVIALVVGLAAASWARPDRLLARLDATAGDTSDLRPVIWRESRAMAARYAATGVGAGAYPAAMAYYQPPPREVFFNHAHNQYLELAAEGGVLLALPLVIFVGALGVTIVRRARGDQTAFIWIRIGATAGLIGLAVMAIWESPFRTPATLIAAAAAAGFAASEGRR